MAPASIRLTLFEPVVFLRGQSAAGEDGRGRRRQINFDAPPSQLRGLMTLDLPKASKIKEISLLLQGKARTDWPEGIGPNRLDTVEESIIFSQKIILFSAKDAPPSQNLRRANSAGVLLDGDRGELSRSSRSPSTSGVSSSGNLGKAKGHESERNPTLARSLGSAAARAGTAMLPPTLVREINASKQSTTGKGRSASSSPMRSPLSGRTSLSRQTSHQNGGSSSSYFDAPPTYSSDDRLRSASVRPFSSTSTSPITPCTPEEMSLSSASAPGASMQDWLTDVPDTGAQQHPQTINAAGPSNRSILHPAGRQEARQRTGSSAGVGVRFDPQAINAALQQQCNTSLSPSLPESTIVTAGFSAESGSNRTSSEQIRPSSTGKGKGRATSSSPGQGSRKGIKGLLGSLLKEDEQVRSSEGSNNNINGGTTGAAMDDTEGSNVALDYRDFAKGTYTYPFSIPLPPSLPPTLHADFGSNTYVARAHVHRAGPLTSNLTMDKEITLVHAPDEDGQDENEAIVVERNWEDCLRYIVVVMGKSFPVGSKIPVWVKFVPTEKVRIHRIVASLEERTAYFAKGRRVARHEVPRRWNLLRLVAPEKTKDGILPIISDKADALATNMLRPYAQAAAKSYSETSNVDAEDVLASLLDPFGPWELAMDLEVPIQGGPIINISTNHKKSNIAVSHLVKLAIRIERVQGSSNERKLYDILIEAPVTINHSHTANAWLSLPDYWSARQGEPGPSSSISPGRAQDARQRDIAALRRQTAPSLTPSRTMGASSRVEAVTGRSTSPPPAPPLQGRVSTNLIQLSQQWLSLTANQDIATADSTVVPMTSQQQEEDSGLPTYAMIDNARGSVDLPRGRDETSVK